VGERHAGRLSGEKGAAHHEYRLGHPLPRRQHLASLRMLFDWLITGQVIDANPAAAVRAASTS